MSNKQDIVLIYSKKDNELIEGKMKGWVTNFHKFLSTLIYQITKKKPQIKIINESDFSVTDLENSHIVLAIITSNLTKETKIIKELNAYGKRLKQQKTFLVDGTPRFFKILKRPYNSAKKLPEFEDLLTYDFYLLNTLTGESQEFTRFFESDAERGYWMKLVDMAYDINHILHIINDKKDKNESIYEDIPLNKTVYLASTGVDMVIQRDIIKRELIRHGYKVLPNHSIPKEARILEKIIKEDMVQCRLSIHLIGEDYGYKPKGSELSVVDIQNRIASDYTHQILLGNKKVGEEEEKKVFSRLIWVSPDLKNITERQKIFIEDLKSNAASLEESEVLQIPLHELKSIIREELVTGGRFNVKRDINLKELNSKDKKSKMVYLIADKRDIDNINDIHTYLKSKGLNIVFPSYEGDLVDIRYIHQENLKRCDASIIYFGKATENWIKTKLQDLLKAPGFGREKPITVKAVYFEGQKNVDRKHYKKNNTMILENNESVFNPDYLKPFLTKIKAL